MRGEEWISDAGNATAVFVCDPPLSKEYIGEANKGPKRA